MKYDLKVINKYVEDGLLLKQVHPTLPLSIYNYSRTCTWEGRWDEITLAARGFVLDNEGTVVAWPFPKFFNIEQLPGLGISIPNEPFDVYNKADGSLLIVFFYDGEWHCASRGSFTSEYAQKGMELLKKYPIDLLYTPQTYCFELLWRERTIVLTPEKDDIVLLGAFVAETGEEMDIQIPYYKENFNVVKKFDGINDYSVLKSMVTDDMEGFVVRFKSGFRMKIKGENYCRLHSIVTGISTIDIWEHLRDGKNIKELMDNVPDEFDQWVTFQIKKLEDLFTQEWEHAVTLYNSIYNKFGGLPPKGVFAEQAKLLNEPKYLGMLFNMYDDRPVDAIIWKNIRPVHEKPMFKI